MIIRSQDKKSITNFSQLTDISIHPIGTNISTYYTITACYPYSIGDDYANMTLARYSTEEKAIKVLDMIQYAAIKDGLGAVHGAFNIPKCFQMPQDSEV